MTFIDKFLDWAHFCLLENEEAQTYLLSRGISSDQWSRHRLGFIGGQYDVISDLDPSHSNACFHRDTKHLRCDSCHYKSWSSIWEGDDSHKEQLVGKRIIGSIVFPLTTYSSQCIGFQIRSLKEKVYDTFMVRRRPEGFFFGTSSAIESIWATQTVTLVEGPADQLIFERLVSPNVLALTTNSVADSHFRFLRRFVRHVNLCLDLDKAGRDGASSFLKREHDFHSVTNIKYPKMLKPGVDSKLTKDVNDLWQCVGDSKFKQIFSKLIT